MAAEKKAKNHSNVAIVRVEEVCPFPTRELRAVMNQYKNASEYVWAQEEHRNMGAWFFVQPRFENLLGIKLKYAGRDVNCAPAVGINDLNVSEVKHILTKPFDSI